MMFPRTGKLFNYMSKTEMGQIKTDRKSSVKNAEEEFENSLLPMHQYHYERAQFKKNSELLVKIPIINEPT